MTFNKKSPFRTVFSSSLRFFSPLLFFGVFFILTLVFTFTYAETPPLNAPPPCPAGGCTNPFQIWLNKATLKRVLDNSSDASLFTQTTKIGGSLTIGGLETTTLKVTTGAVLNKVLTSDANGNATWQLTQKELPQTTTANKVLTSNTNGNPTWNDFPKELPTGTSGQTLRSDGTNWIANSALKSDGTNVTIGGTSGNSNKLLLTSDSNSHYLRAKDWWLDIVGNQNEVLRVFGGTNGATEYLKVGGDGVVTVANQLSTGKGVLFTPLATAPVTCSATNKGFTYFTSVSNKHMLCNGSAWVDYTGPQGPPGAPGSKGDSGVSPFTFSPYNSNNIYYSNGSVGIGTNSPSMSLDVTQPSLWGAPAIGGSNGDRWAYLHIPVGAHALIWDNKSAMRFGVEAQKGGGWTELMRIMPNGNVGIGKDPGYKLDVAGDINISYLGNQVALKKDEKLALATDRIGLDVAELFETKETVEVGDIVVVAKQERKLEKSSKQYQSAIIGIVSGSPAIVFEGSDVKAGARPNRFTKGEKPPIALAGRVPVKVSLENGPIDPGDYLTTSSISGTAMRATEPGATVGVALEGYNGTGIGSVLAFINVGEKNNATLVKELERRVSDLEKKVGK